jgi:hypothetical protein
MTRTRVLVGKFEFTGTSPPTLENGGKLSPCDPEV